MISPPRIWHERWIPLLLWCALILTMSSDALSWGETSRWLSPVLALLFPGGGPETLETAHVVVRKLAHVGEFLVLGWLVVAAIGGWQRETTIALGALVFVTACASIDECRQALTLTRGATVFDVGFDCLGGVLGIALRRIGGTR